MTDWQETYREARQTTGRARVRALLVALDQADAVNEVDGAFDIRMDIVNTAYDAGDPVPALAAFAWCLARHDEDPGRFARHAYSLGWRHKWMPVWAMEFPGVAAERLEGMVDDLERRHVASGAGRRQALGIRLQLAVATGIGRPLDELLVDWRTSGRTSMSDCYACEILTEARVELALGRTDDALAIVDPLLGRGASFCSDGPEAVMALAVPLLVASGREGDASRVFQRALKGARAKPRRKADSLAELVSILARADDAKRTRKLLAAASDLADDAPSPGAAMAVAARFSRALRVIDPDVELALAGDGPRSIRASKGDGAWRAGPLADALARRATEAASQFDRRNGTEVASLAVTASLGAPDLGPVVLFPSKKPKVDPDAPTLPFG